MTTDREVVVMETDGMVDQITQLVQAIESATVTEATTAHDRIRVAREWAKLQANAAELSERLLWLEAVILRRIGRLDPKVLHSTHRAAARHFATLDDADLSKLVNDYPARTAVSCYNLWARAQGIKAQYRRGLAAPDPEPKFADTDPRTLKTAIVRHTMSVRQAAAVILAEYANGPRQTVSQIVETFVAEEMPDVEWGDNLERSAFRLGLADAVRGAFADCEVPSWGSSAVDWIPAFITTFDEATDQWVRVMAEFATVGQAKQMVELRRGHLASMQRSLDELEGNLSLVWAERSDDDYLLGGWRAEDVRREYAERTTEAAS